MQNAKEVLYFTDVDPSYFFFHLLAMREFGAHRHELCHQTPTLRLH